MMMQLHVFTAKWFALYYPVLGFMFMISGGWLMLKPNAFLSYLKTQSHHKTPPALIRTILKYFLLFSIVCLIFSFIPFSWVELLFSLWSLCIIYIAGIPLLRWTEIKSMIRDKPDPVRRIINITGAIMLAVTPVMFLLSYLAIKRLSLF